MASIKDVAAKAGVSMSTVSIIINGKSSERKISQKTTEKVLLAMKQLDYRPNIAARKLRNAQVSKSLAIFWTKNFSKSGMARILSSIQNKNTENNFNYDISIYTYESGSLSSHSMVQGILSFHGAIIVGANDSDLQFLTSIEPKIPIVLYNRRLSGFSSVFVCDEKVGGAAVELLGNAKTAAVVRAPMSFNGLKTRDDTVIAKLEKNGVKVLDFTSPSDDSAGGFAVCERMRLGDIDAIYAASDALAVGLIRHITLLGYRIPRDIKVVAIGRELPEIDEFLSPPLSTVHIPMEEMAGCCLEILEKSQISGEIIEKEFEAEAVSRISTRR